MASSPASQDGAAAPTTLPAASSFLSGTAALPTSDRTTNTHMEKESRVAAAMSNGTGKPEGRPPPLHPRWRPKATWGSPLAQVNASSRRSSGTAKQHTYSNMKKEKEDVDRNAPSLTTITTTTTGSNAAPGTIPVAQIAAVSDLLAVALLSYRANPICRGTALQYRY